jgi:hypothetical protein
MKQWMKSDTDRMLDLFLGGIPEDAIALKMNANVADIEDRIDAFLNNTESRCLNYQPVRRVGRHKKPLSENELLFISRHKRVGVSMIETARVLQRDVSELQPDSKGRSQAKQSKGWAPTLDYYLACRYCLEVYEKEVVGEDVMEEMREEEKELGGGSLHVDMEIRSVPRRIKSLAMYLTLKKEEDEK